MRILAEYEYIPLEVIAEHFGCSVEFVEAQVLHRAYLWAEKQDTHEVIQMLPADYTIWLNEVLAKMKEADARAYVFDRGLYYDDTVPASRSLKDERIYAKAMGVTPRLTKKVGVHDYDG